MSKLRNVLVSSGERSGDVVAASYVTYLINRGVRCFGLGGAHLLDLGLEPICEREGVSVTGLSEAIGGLLPTIRVYKKLAAQVAGADALLLSDFPEVNVRLLKLARRHNVPVIYLAPPQAWAWRPWRVKPLMSAHYVGCLFPFSCDWYQGRGVSASWIGHPLALDVAPVPSDSTHVSLMPGSRLPTIKRILPAMVELANQMAANLIFTLILSSEVSESAVKPLLGSGQLRIGMSSDVETSLKRSVLALTHPGTATLHAVLRGCIPLAMCNPAPMSHFVGSQLIRVEHLSLPNLILDERVFPEFVLSKSQSAQRLKTAMRLLEQPHRFQNAMTQVWSLCRNTDIESEHEKAFQPLFS